MGCSCLSSTPEEGAEHGRGEAIIVVGGVLGAWALNRECGWMVQSEYEKCMADSRDIWVWIQLWCQREHTGRKAPSFLELLMIS